MGPFEVAPEAIERLATGFTDFVNHLLAKECAKAGLQDHELRLNNKENIPDGGVDAEIDGVINPGWLPKGRSAWQFKRSDLRPGKCKKELLKATWAQALLLEGGEYRLVLGACLTSQQLEKRRKELIVAAEKLGVPYPKGRIQVLDANAIARWASEFPSLAVSRMLGGPGLGVIDFDEWSDSSRHQTAWVLTRELQDLVGNIRTAISEQQPELRLVGPSGIGKTRLVMEALRDSKLVALIAYVPDEGKMAAEIFHHMFSHERSVIMVIDECSGRKHEKIAERISTGSNVRLFTIGEADGYPLRTPVLRVEAWSIDDIENFLAINYPKLWAEARRFAATHSNGNIGFAVVLAGRILAQPQQQAADLIAQNDLKEFVTDLMLDERYFFLAAVLALFERVGWDRELRPELENIAKFAGSTPAELDALSFELQKRGIQVQQGRYRAISPHPLAIVLAAEAWTSLGRRIIDELMPSLNRDMILSLFRRTADLGGYEPAQRSLKELMSGDGIFGTLDSIERYNLGQFLTELAVVAPEDTLSHLANIIESETIESLKSQVRSRRDLVWTLEKLAWHSHLFRTSANLLLKLALAENESYGNNATGTWIELFGAILPGTAASPNQRLEYLSSLVRSDNPQVRILIIQACDRGLRTNEVIAVSGELQGGRLVEPRGGTGTSDALACYQCGIIDILSLFSKDLEEAVALAAAKVLTESIFGLLLRNETVQQHFVKALAKLEGPASVKLRREIYQLRGRALKRDDSELINGLIMLEKALGEITPVDELRILLDLEPWDYKEAQLRDRVAVLVHDVIEAGGIATIFGWLREERVESSWHLGNILATEADRDADALESLAAASDLNPAALTGFLSGLTQAGDEAAFDRFLDSDLAQQLSDRQVLFTTVRGPITGAAKIRIHFLLERMPILEAVGDLFFWSSNLDEFELDELLNLWQIKLESQEDYNAVVDFINIWQHDRPEPEGYLRGSIWRLLEKRRDYPDLRDQRWDWAELASHYCSEKPTELAQIILDEVSNGKQHIHESDFEAKLFGELIAADPVGVWNIIGKELLENNWRVSMTFSKWVSKFFPIEKLSEWIGNSVERAERVAEIADVGENEPTPLARYLLEAYGSDKRVTAALSSNYLTGSWWGKWSDRLGQQIQQLEDWSQRPDESTYFRKWALDMIGHLQIERQQALEHESEERT